jgi:hypothetical protein
MKYANHSSATRPPCGAACMNSHGHRWGDGVEANTVWKYAAGSPHFGLFHESLSFEIFNPDGPGATS